MAKLNEYVTLQKQLEELQKQLDKISGDESFKKELEFKHKLEQLMDKYGKTAKETVQLLDPHPTPASGSATASGSGRKKRKLKTYEHPNTHEKIETRGGNHKVLKEWKAEFGDETVEGWLISEE